LPHGVFVNEWGEDVIVSPSKFRHHDRGAITQRNWGSTHLLFIDGDIEIRFKSRLDVESVSSD
jgi:hypothetical protein